MNRVVLLGANGFIGRQLHRYLSEQSVEVLPLARKEIPSLSRLLRPSDSLVFLAAVTPDRDKSLEAFVSNIQIAKSLGEILEKKPIAHLIYISSDAVYPSTVEQISEETPAAPESLYGTMHLAREQMLKTLSPTTILRLTMVYGADDTHNAYGPSQFRRIAETEGKITLFGGGEERRDYIYIDDVVQLITHCLYAPQEKVLNIATGNSISFAELAQKIASICKRPITISSTPRKVPLSHRGFDITSLKRAFPHFELTPIDEGLQKIS